MRFVGFVVLPFLFQLALVLVIIALSRGNGSFVGLAAMGLGLWVLPITAVINWWGCRRASELGLRRLVLRSLLVTLVLPALLVAMIFLGV
jgi:hypothetical protein